MADSKPVALDSAAATEFLAAPERVKPHVKLIGVVTQGSLPALLPFLKPAT